MATVMHQSGQKKTDRLLNGRRGVNVASLLNAVAANDSEATDRLWVLVKRRLTYLARQEVFSVHRTFDEDDVVIIVFTSLCRWLVDGNQYKIEDLQHLEKQLAVMTARTVIDLHRYEKRHCRGGLAEFCSETSVCQIVDDAPGPRCRALYNDDFSRFEQSLNDSAKLRRLLVARLEGNSHEELAQMFCCSVRTIERRMAELRRRFLEHLNVESL